MEFEDSESLLGPEVFVRGNIPAEAACVTESLRFRKIRFAPAEFLGEEFVRRNVYGAANVLFQALVFESRSTDAANVSDLTIGTHDALCGIEGRSFRSGFLDQVCHELRDRVGGHDPGIPEH